MRQSHPQANSVTAASCWKLLIGVLIFSFFGILGIVGLLGAIVRHTGDAEYRAEATYLAEFADLEDVPTDDLAALKAKYDSTVGGAGYVIFKGEAASLPASARRHAPTQPADGAGRYLGKRRSARPTRCHRPHRFKATS